MQAVTTGEKKKDVAEHFGTPQSSLSTMLKAKDTTPASLQTRTSGQHKRVKLAVYENKAVFTWFMSARAAESEGFHLHAGSRRFSGKRQVVAQVQR